MSDEVTAVDLENPEVQKAIAAQVAERLEVKEKEIDDKYKGLENNRDELIAEKKAEAEKRKEYEAQAEAWGKATGGKTTDEVAAMFESIENKEIEKLLGEGNVDEVLELRFKKERESFHDELAERDRQLTEREQAIAERDERLTKLEVDKVSTESFIKAKGAETAITDMVGRVRSAITYDEDGKRIFKDEFGRERKSSDGTPMTIESYINEDLRSNAPHLFTEPAGSGAQGSGNGGPSGITKTQLRKDPDKYATFIAEYGGEAYAKLPA